MNENENQPEKKIGLKKVKSIQQLARLADEEASNSVQQEFTYDEELSDEDKQTIDILKDTQNPALSYKLFYAIQGLMKQFLPKGEQFKALREYAYELKNILLTQGKQKNELGIRGADSRQAYIAGELKVMYDLITDWVNNGATAIYLIERLQSLNDERGYSYEGSPKKK